MKKGDPLDSMQIRAEIRIKIGDRHKIAIEENKTSIHLLMCGLYPIIY
jgi:hypothetical protein